MLAGFVCSLYETLRLVESGCGWDRRTVDSEYLPSACAFPLSLSLLHHRECWKFPTTGGTPCLSSLLC